MKDFNFFLPYLSEDKEVKDKKAHIIITISIVTAIILGSFLYNTIYSIVLNNQIDSLKEELNSTENVKKLKKAEELIEKQKVLKKYSDNIEIIYNSIEDKSKVSSDLLVDISKSIPKDISFKNMTVDYYNIQIQGVAKSRVSIAELEHNLKALANISDVHISSINNEGVSSEEYSFSLKCVIKSEEKK